MDSTSFPIPLFICNYPQMLGCNLQCAFCWVYNTKRIGEDCNPYATKWTRNTGYVDLWPYQSPKETFNWLHGQAIMYGLKRVRVSGCEPLINPEHLLKVIELSVRAGYEYMLDTNGLLLSQEFLDRLEPFKDHVEFYIGLKGANPEHFKAMTGMNGKNWYRQLAALKMVKERRFTLGINLMANLTPPEALHDLYEELRDIADDLPLSMDLKHTTFFPYNLRRVRAYNLQRYSGVMVRERWNSIIRHEYGQELDFKNVVFHDGLVFVRPGEIEPPEKADGKIKSYVDGLEAPSVDTTT